MSDEMITISKAEYEQLEAAADFLECLEACGVDNWVGYSDAWAMHREDGGEYE